jgi:predicted Zn-dependent peptidase
VTRQFASKAALAAAFSIFGLLPAAAAAPLPSVSLASTGVLPGGGQYVVSHTDSAPVAAIALWYRAPASGFDAAAGVPGLGRLAAATVAGSAPITGTPLGRYVSELGGRIAISAYPDSVAVSALVPAENAADVVHAMTVSFFAPVVTADGLKLAQRDVGEEAFFRQFNSEQTIDDALVGSLFSDGPAHFPSLGKSEDVGKITLDQVRAYAERAFRPSNAVLVVTGAVDASVVSTAVPGRADTAPQPEPQLQAHLVPQPEPIATTGVEAGQGLGWIGPAISDEREATALDFVSDYLFRPDTGIVQRAAATTKSSVSGKFVTYHDPGVVLVTISGGDVPAARNIVDDALASMRKPLDRSTFAAARDAFLYHMLSDIQTPGGMADTLGWYTVEGNQTYAPGAGGASSRYFAVAGSLTPAFVAATVNKYLSRPGAVVAVEAKKTESTTP